MGLSTKKQSNNSTSTTSNTSHITNAPTNPAWVDEGLAGLGKDVANLGSADPYQFVAGADPLQQQAATSASGLTTNPGYGQAADIYRGVAGAGPNTYGAATLDGPNTYDASLAGAQGYGANTGTASHAQSASLLDHLNSYMNPYTDAVVNSTLRGYDQNANLTRSQQMLDLANDTTFGGSGGSILRAQTEGQLGLGRAQTEAQLRDQAFNTGASLSGQDADRRQATSLYNAGADNTYGLANMDALNHAAEFGANANNTASLANAGAINAGRQFNANAGNTFALTNQGAVNHAREFNAGQADTAQARALAAAQGLSGNATAQGNDTRSNIGLQSDIGAQLQAIAQKRAGAPLALLAARAGLYSGMPLNLLHGSTSDGTNTGTTTSTGTTKESGASTGDWLNYFASNARAASGGGG